MLVFQNHKVEDTTYGWLQATGYWIGGLSRFNGCFDPQFHLHLIVEAKHGFIEALHRQNCLLWVAPERFPH
jgi:hypothetical protein